MSAMCAYACTCACACVCVRRVRASACVAWHSFRAIHSGHVRGEAGLCKMPVSVPLRSSLLLNPSSLLLLRVPLALCPSVCAHNLKPYSIIDSGRLCVPWKTGMSSLFFNRCVHPALFVASWCYPVGQQLLAAANFFTSPGEDDTHRASIARQRASRRPIDAMLTASCGMGSVAIIQELHLTFCEQQTDHHPHSAVASHIMVPTIHTISWPPYSHLRPLWANDTTFGRCLHHMGVKATFLA